MNPWISRRAVLAGASTAALVACSNADEVEYSALKAIAVDPATAIMIAKTGLEVFRLVKGGGGGIANLLVAQTEMLRAMSAQLAVVNDGIQLIIAGVEGLKSMVRDLPSNTVRELARSDVQAAFVNLTEKLDRLAMLRVRYGHAYALEQVRGDAALNLGRLEHSRAALMGDQSPIVIPLVAAAWYVEFQALTSLVPFERERLLSVARSYERWARRTAPLVDQLVADSVAEAKELTRAADDFWGPTAQPVCYAPITTTHPRAEFRQLSSSKFTVDYRPHETERALFASHFAELEQAGVAVMPELRSMRETLFDTLREPTSINILLEAPGGPVSTMNDFRAIQRWRRTIESHPSCSDPSAFAKPKAGQMDLATTVVREKALMHYHFHLAHREALRSVQRAIQALEA